MSKKKKSKLITIIQEEEKTLRTKIIKVTAILALIVVVALFFSKDTGFDPEEVIGVYELMKIEGGQSEIICNSYQSGVIEVLPLKTSINLRESTYFFSFSNYNRLEVGGRKIEDFNIETEYATACRAGNNDIIFRICQVEIIPGGEKIPDEDTDDCFFTEHKCEFTGNEADRKDSLQIANEIEQGLKRCLESFRR